MVNSALEIFLVKHMAQGCLHIQGAFFFKQLYKLSGMTAHGPVVYCFAIHKQADIRQQPLQRRPALSLKFGTILQQPGNHA